MCVGGRSFISVETPVRTVVLVCGSCGRRSLCRRTPERTPPYASTVHLTWSCMAPYDFTRQSWSRVRTILLSACDQFSAVKMQHFKNVMTSSYRRLYHTMTGWFWIRLLCGYSQLTRHRTDQGARVYPAGLLTKRGGVKQYLNHQAPRGFQISVGFEQLKYEWHRL